MEGDGRIVIVEPEVFAETAAGRIAAALHACIARGGAAGFALTGGSTAAPVYERLAARQDVSFGWNAVTFYFGDERAVAPDHPDSNYRLAHETLFSRLPIAPGRIHRMEAERDDLEQAARDYERVLPASLDLLLLGMGSDGHIASLFPGNPALRERWHRVAPVFGGEPRMARLTITPPVIRQAARIILIGAGRSKREAVARALQGPLDPEACPAQLARRAEWVLDRAAGAGLPGPA